VGDRAVLDQERAASAAVGAAHQDAAAAEAGRVAGDGAVADGPGGGRVAVDVDAAALGRAGVAGDGAILDEQRGGEADADAAAVAVLRGGIGPGRVAGDQAVPHGQPDGAEEHVNAAAGTAGGIAADDRVLHRHVRAVDADAAAAVGVQVGAGRSPAG